MAIETQCPHCTKSYRLKDELVGKKVTCANPDCRKVFAADVKPSANGKAGPSTPDTKPVPAPNPTATATAPQPPAPQPPSQPTVGDPTPMPTAKLPPLPPKPKPKVPTAQKAPAKPPIDAEAEAMKALSDEPPRDAGVGDQRKVPMTCGMCDHKWEEAWDKQGKNVICPECRHRQKVPEIKKEDWRTQNKPEGAKIDDVPDNVIASQAKYVSGQAMREAGAIDDTEPRPRWHYAVWVALPLAVLIGLVIAVRTVNRRVDETRQDRFMELARADLTDNGKALTDSQRLLFQTVVLLASGEHALRENKAGDAEKHFAQARADLAEHKKLETRSAERDALFGELLVAQVGLGGTEEQARNGHRLRWIANRGGSAQYRVGNADKDVQNELRQTLTMMSDKATDADARFAALRRLARELHRRDQLAILLPLTLSAFDPAEKVEARAQVALEQFLATKDNGQREKQAEEDAKALVDLVSSTKVAGLSAQVLTQCPATPVKGLPMPLAPPRSGPVQDQTRQAFVRHYLTQKKWTEAVELAAQPGQLESQIAALAAVVEWSESSDAIQSALKAAADAARSWSAQAATRKTLPPLPGHALVRLVQAAARSGQIEPVEPLVEAIADPGLKAWAKAEALRLQLLAAADRKSVEDTTADVPDDAKLYRAGHAWGRLAVARNNAAVTGDRKAADAYERWGSGTFKPFGLAGLSLGLQDRVLGEPAVAPK